MLRHRWFHNNSSIYRKCTHKHISIAFTESQAEPLSRFFGGLESRKYPKEFNHNIVRSHGGRGEKQTITSLHVCSLLLMFDLEFTFISSKAPRSRCNGCLTHCKPWYLACPQRIVPLAGSEHIHTLWRRSLGQGRAGGEGGVWLGETGISKLWHRCHAFPPNKNKKGSFCRWPTRLSGMWQLWQHDHALWSE